MAKLHELLAAEKVPTSAWHELIEDTLRKFKNPAHFFEGHSKTLRMIEESPANEATEGQAREEKAVATTVLDTLRFALDIWSRAEDLQYMKNETNRHALGDVMWGGEVLLAHLPVDELLGLEARLAKIRELFATMPTLDAARHWRRNRTQGFDLWELEFPEETTKTEKQVQPVIFHPATVEHPAQVQAVSKDVVVGKFTTIKRSGAATARQKAECLRRIDDLIVEVKKARMRANETEVDRASIADAIVDLLLDPLKTS